MSTVIHWFRRDLRVRDNTGLFQAAEAAARSEGGGSVTGVFVVDTRWLPAERLKLGAHQAEFWLRSLAELETSLRERNIALVVRQGADPVAEIVRLAREIQAETITFNKEYEPAQRAMDERLTQQAQALGITVQAYKDAVVFEGTEIVTGQGGIYSVFTPYRRAFEKRLAERMPVVLGLPRKMESARPVATQGVPTAASLGFAKAALDVEPGEKAGAKRLAAFCRTGLGQYQETRDFPAIGLEAGNAGTSRLSAHLNAGTMSIRQAFVATLEAQMEMGTQEKKNAETFLGELICGEFYRMILLNFPHTVSLPYQGRYRGVTWKNDPALLAAWQEGRTGYPIVDAAMAQLRQTGFMHNRLRMIAAMFLTKDLDTHWVLGERFFMRTLMDYDQASNVGGWQWSASTGTDAAPYFRVMNPVLQSERFDPEGVFIRHFIPALRQVPASYLHAPWEMPVAVQNAAGCIIGRDYPAPVVVHAEAKKAAVEKFRAKK